MIRFFRSGFFSQYLVIGITGLLMWARAFFDPPLMPVPEGPVPLYSLIYQVLSGLPALAVIIAFLITLFSGFYLNYLLSYHEITTKNSSLPAFLFVIFTSYYPPLLTLNPVNITLLILLFILHRLFSVYRQTEALDTTYGVGFLTAVGSLIYFPFIFIVVLILIALIIFRIAGWREWTSTIIGFITPFIFLAAYFFWMENIAERFLFYIRSFRIINFPIVIPGAGFLVLTSLMALILLISMMSGMAHLSEKNLETRHKTSVLIWLIPVILIQYLFDMAYIQYHLIAAFLTVSALYSSHLLRLKKPFRQEVVLLVIFAFLLVNNLFHILV